MFDLDEEEYIANEESSEPQELNFDNAPDPAEEEPWK